MAPEHTIDAPWSVVHHQFIRHHADAPVAMADAPHRAHEIVALLNAQAVGESYAHQQFQQRLADARDEFRRSLAVARAEGRPARRDEYMRMCDALRLIDQHGCSVYTQSRCWDSGRTRNHRYSADAWCDACIAADALGDGPK